MFTFWECFFIGLFTLFGLIFTIYCFWGEEKGWGIASIILTIALCAGLIFSAIKY